MNINEQILFHFKEGEGAAGYLREKISGLAEMLATFFHARSDIKRIIESEKVAEAILATMEYKEILSLRREVASLEIKRIIAYGKQNDHTAHTVYLFLLGVWMYDNVEEIREAINNKIKSNQKEKMFVFQWVFSSLLHDIGYLYYETIDVKNDTWHLFSEKEKEELPAYQVYGTYYDKLFRDAFENQFTDFSWATDAEENVQSKKALREIWQDFETKYAIETRKARSPEDVLNKLSDMPWLNDLLPGKQNGLAILENTNITKNLINFAYQIATEGYKKGSNDPRTDHAIASGLMLLQYTSIWYWLAAEVEKRKSDDTQYASLFEKIFKAFKYPLGVFQNHVIPACQVAIYHNISDKESITLEKEPLLYLAILCDELQVWDRFVSGSEHLNAWENAETHCMAENVSADIDKDKKHVLFDFEYIRFKKKVVDTLNHRLIDWDKFVKISELVQ